MGFVDTGLAGIRRDAFQKCVPFSFAKQTEHIKRAAKPDSHATPEGGVHVREGVLDYIERHAFIEICHRMLW